METIHIETRREAADRLEIQATLQREADYKRKCAQALAADEILCRRTIEHVTLWTDVHGRPRHETRIESVS